MDKPHDSHLFTMRLWAEDLGDGQIEWRGKLHHVTSGEARYFRDWPVLIGLPVRIGHTRRISSGSACD